MTGDAAATTQHLPELPSTLSLPHLRGQHLYLPSAPSPPFTSSPLLPSFLILQPLFSSFFFVVFTFSPHLTPTPPPAGGSEQRALRVAGEGSPAADSQPEPVLAGARRVRAGGAAQRRAAEDAQRWGDARTPVTAPVAGGRNMKAAFNVETGARHTCINNQFFVVCVFFFFWSEPPYLRLEQ